MRSALLVPTDFSENAWVAAQYAAHLATKYNWDIHLLHTYHAFTSAFAGPQFNEEMTEHASNKATDGMDGVAARLAEAFPNLLITSASIQGMLGDILPDIAQNEHIKFVVMGTKGATGLKHVILGSNTFEIIQKSPVGVLAIPETYTNFRLKKVGLLSNFKETEIELLQAFTNRTTTALEVVLLHVTEPDKPVDERDVDYWTTDIQQRSGIEKISYRTDSTLKGLDGSETIPQRIAYMVQEEDIDLLLVSYNRKGFFKQLFAKSLAKTIAHNLPVPAFFHRDES